MQTTSHPKLLAKIWREIKRPFRKFAGMMEKRRTIRSLASAKSQIRSLFGESGEIDKEIDAVLRFYRWSMILGPKLTRKLRIPDPFPEAKHHPHYFRLFSRHVGIDLQKEILTTDEALVFDDIKIPLPRNESDKAMLIYELRDIVFPAYLRRTYDSFDRYCGIMENHLNDFEEGPYEFGEVSMKEGDVVFDCGANTGVFSAVASRYGAEVYAFEAIPSIIDNYLSKTAAMNKNIRVCPYAVWDKEETLEFSFLVDYIGASRCDQLLYKSQLKENRRQFAVPAITLDAFAERNGIERIDFIKADIEGAERNMLRGATRILREFAPKLSICTYHLPDDPRVLRELILAANPEYRIAEKFKKMYAWVPGK